MANIDPTVEGTIGLCGRPVWVAQTLAQAVERFSKLTGIDASISEKYIRGIGRDNIISLNSERQNRASKSEETDDRTR